MKKSVLRPVSSIPIDLVHRFAPTPLQATIHWSGKMISFATNSSIVLERIADAAREGVELGAREADCSWRVVTEPDDGEESEFDSLSRRYVGDEGVSFMTVGRRSFLAYDDRTRRGISFLSERLVQDRTLFVEVFLPGLAALLQGAD